MQGWISLHRKIMKSAVWSDPNYLKLWMYCLLKSTHTEHEQIIGNQKIKLGTGQFITGRKVLANDLNSGVKPKFKQSEISWWRYLNNLAKWEMLNIKKTNKYSIVTIVNWKQYQQSEQQMNNKRTTDEQQMNTNNNGNKGNNENKDTSRSKYSFETHHFKLAELLYKEILKNNYKFKKPNLESWANTFRLMMERDKRTGKDIQDMILFSQQHNFWHKNILSADKLRKQFDRLTMEKSGNKKEIDWEAL